MARWRWLAKVPRGNSDAQPSGRYSRGKGRNRQSGRLRNMEEQNSGGFLKWLVLMGVLGVLAVTLSEGLRDRVLDALFGAEEEFNYEPSPDGTVGTGRPAPVV